MAEQSIEELKQQLAKYETNGAASLFYSLNRKQNEMAALLNKTKLENLDLSDKDNKTFERIKILWGEAATVATAVKTLEATAGITQDEARDTQIPIFRVTPESMADSIGELAGKKS
jgi:hypothetical protein